MSWVPASLINGGGMHSSPLAKAQSPEPAVFSPRSNSMNVDGDVPLSPPKPKGRGSQLPSEVDLRVGII